MPMISTRRTVLMPPTRWARFIGWLTGRQPHQESRTFMFSCLVGGPAADRVALDIEVVDGVALRPIIRFPTDMPMPVAVDGLALCVERPGAEREPLAAAHVAIGDSEPVGPVHTPLCLIGPEVPLGRASR